MKFYLSSYKLGNEIEKLKAMISLSNKRTAYISNALDFSDDSERRKQSEQADIDQLNIVGLSDIEKIDLRDYFSKKDELEKKISGFDVIWVRGGNCFVLRQAMKLSGFDEILKDLFKKEGIIYGGYSAGVCVLAPTLKGIDLIDDPKVNPYTNQEEIIWDGVDLLDYTILPHYKSDHFESEKVDEAVEYMKNNKIPFKPLRDGEVIIIE
ncbi:MAG: Type 1 glutamine amidotransferase-like domain-containing protein [Candidatus Pacebacteria bacterium]|nr:Type 1 glutamine amidotransferase-like domain-containing protein [Candidatus Paceibacterota bacterium]